MIQLVILVALLFCASVSEATTYYVRTDGNNGNSGTANTAGGAWLTIAHGCSSVSAGDTVRVQAGTYVETASGCISGTNTSTAVTLVSDGVVITCGLSVTSKNYIRIIGFTFDRSTGGCAAGNIVTGTGVNTGLEFWNNIFQNNQSKAISFDVGGNGSTCPKCLFIGNSFLNFGNPSNPTVMTISGDDMVAAYNTFSNIAEIGIGPSGTRIRMLNNKFSGLVEVSAGHPDFYYIAVGSTGYSNSLIEATFGIGTISAPNNKFAHNQNDSPVDWVDDVYRLNVATQIGSGIYSIYSTGKQITRMRWYHDTFVLNDRGVAGSTGCGSGRADLSNVETLFFTNELYQECWSSNVSSFVDSFSPAGGTGTLTYTEDYNLAYDPDGAVTFTSTWNAQTHKQSNVNPQLTNIAGNDFTLQSSSGARGVGGPLTTAVSCSGSVLTVATNGAANFFPDNSSNVPAYSGAFVPGDSITVGTSTRKILTISGDVITVDASLTCAASDPVYFGSSSTVDIGAYPYKASGYTLSATYNINGSIATISPNDSSLVRWVVCYNDSVPIAVVNASPFMCTVGNGTFLARVYPRYASQTLSVDASLSTVNPNRFRYFRKKGD